MANNITGKCVIFANIILRQKEFTYYSQWVKDFTVFYRDIYTYWAYVIFWRRMVKDRFIMDIKDIYKRLWHAPDGHIYFGWFSPEIPDHLFDVSKFLEILYSVTYPQEVAGDIDKLVIAYFLEASSEEARGTEAREMFSTAEPVVWFEKKLISCVTYHWDLVSEYKKAMGLPIQTVKDRLNEYHRVNGEQP